MNGVLIVKKPKGLTSRDVVNKIEKILNTKKIGHTGTLDPIATGVLVLCIGNCLKLVELLMEHDKEYIAKIKLGIETDTLDITGKIIKEEPVPIISEEQIKKTLTSFLGEQNQQVPIYSSVKVNGKKLYEYARKNKKVQLPTRKIKIYSIELLNRINNEEFTIKCHVSKGTYIRSLVRDIGKSLNVSATMKELERTKLDKFTLDDAYSIEDIEKGNYKLLSPTQTIDLKKVIVNKELEKKIRNGQVLPKFFDEDMAFILNENNTLLAIYQKKDKELVKPYRMFIN